MENELSDIVEQYVNDPFWSRRVIVLLGSALRTADLIRAKYEFRLHSCTFLHYTGLLYRARETEACFIRTAKDKESVDEAVSIT